MEYKNLLIYIYFWKIKKNIIYKAKFRLFLMSMACKYIIIMKWKQSWESYFTQKPEITEKIKYNEKSWSVFHVPVIGASDSPPSHKLDHLNSV